MDMTDEINDLLLHNTDQLTQILEQEMRES